MITRSRSGYHRVINGSTSGSLRMEPGKAGREAGSGELPVSSLASVTIHRLASFRPRRFVFGRGGTATGSRAKGSDRLWLSSEMTWVRSKLQLRAFSSHCKFFAHKLRPPRTRFISDCRHTCVLTPQPRVGCPALGSLQTPDSLATAAKQQPDHLPPLFKARSLHFHAGRRTGNF